MTQLIKLIMAIEHNKVFEVNDSTVLEKNGNIFFAFSNDSQSICRLNMQSDYW